MKKFLILAMAVLVLATTFCLGAFAVEVGTADELVAIMFNPGSWGEDITLTADIDLTGKEQTPIGNYTNPYTGTFDGASFTISGLNIANAETVFALDEEGNGTLATIDDLTVGLFGVVQGATIRDLTVKGVVTNNFVAPNAESKVDGYHSASGGIVGTAFVGTTLENLTSYVEVNGPCHVGGVAGYLKNFEDDGDIDVIVAENCVNYGTVNPVVGNTGGVFGRIYVKTSCTDNAVVIESCVNYADVTSNSIDRNRLAGIVGYVRSEGGVIVINNCRNEGKITGDVPEATGNNRPYVGAMAGRIELTAASAALQVTNCVNTGEIVSSYIGGGITGLFTRGAVAIENPSVVENCINTASVRGDGYAAGIVGCSDCAAPTVAEGEDATPYLVKVENNINFGNVVLGSSSGGVISQAKGVNVVNNVTLENTVCKVASAGVGTFVVENNYFLKGMLLDLSPIGTNVEITMDDVANAETFATLDFDNVWEMKDGHPMLVAFADEDFDVVVKDAKPAVDLSDLIGGSNNEETTADVEGTAASTDAAEGNDAVVGDVTPDAADEGGNDGGNSMLIWIIIGAAVAVVVVVVLVIVLKKKKQ